MTRSVPAVPRGPGGGPGADAGGIRRPLALAEAPEDQADDDIGREVDRQLRHVGVGDLGCQRQQARSYGVKTCTIVSGRAGARVDLDVAPLRLQGTLTVTPSYGKVGGRTAIRSFMTTFEIVTICSGGSCGTPKVIDVTGSLCASLERQGRRVRQNQARTLRQKVRPSP